MIRTLYFRIAVVIFIVVWSSLFLSSLLFSRNFRSQLSAQAEERLMNDAKAIAGLIGMAAPDRIEQTVSNASRLNRILHLQLFDESGNRFSPNPETACPGIGGKTVRYVLDGNVYSSFKDEKAAECYRGLVGLPVQSDERRYALFVSPYFTKQLQEFEHLRIRNLGTGLVISVVLTGIAAVYVVRPLKKITEATRRISEGDFDVRLNIRQNNELGVLADSINRMAGELKKMERMRQEFVTNVSHDIQTPLTSIRGFSKLLQQDSIDPEERLSYLRLIESESERLSRLSENLLKLASLDSEHHPFHPATIQLDEQLRRCVVACEPLWAAKRLEIDLDLPDVTIVADEDSLNQVWSNLLHNSIKFTPPGGRISVVLRDDDKFATVRIADTGIGIAPEHQENVFRRFYKADASRKNSGSGLGLAIVKKIVDLHHGHISLTSRVNEGTTVEVRLPKNKP